MPSKTQELIESSMAADQGNGYRSYLQEAVNSCSDAFRIDDKPFRKHLGASLLGRKCARELWYGFRWFTLTEHTGRMQRLFNRGHMEEGRFIAMLRSIGVEVWCEDVNGDQFRMKACGGHLGGSLDSVIRGTPDFGPTAILSEYKTHGEKSFNKLKKDGVKESKWEHYVQMQLYMGAYDLPYALYMAINKNTDELYTELVPFDAATRDRYMVRGEKIIFVNEPPPRISESKTHFECRFCDHYGVCHNGYTPERNCRTCAYSVPQRDGTWLCTRHNGVIPTEFQYTGCDVYECRSY